MLPRLTAIVGLLLCVWLLSACGGSSSSTTSVQSIASSATSSATASPHAQRHRQHRTARTQPSPGSSPQTEQMPSADTRGFQDEMAAMWRGVQDDSVKTAMPAFFPEAAYVQVKTLGDPKGDWVIRLLLDYRLDIADAHALLGAAAHGAQLIGVEVPRGYAHWVSPGACYNGVGYYEVPNSRVVYREGREVHSFGIASMISWRGVWYVIHLGAITRVGNIGVLDDPSVGSGASVPLSTC